MKMIKNFSLFSLLLSVCIFQSCEDNSETSTVDLINVIRNGATIPAYIYGNTSSDVFLINLHGGPGSSGLEYRGGQFSDLLESSYAVVYTDQRGQGMSQGNYGEEFISPTEMAGDVHGLARALKTKYGEDISLFLMGHSWGGLLGSEVMINEEYAKEYKGWIDIDGAHSLPLTFKSAVRKIDSVANQQINANVDIETWQSYLDTIATVDTFNDDGSGFSKINRLGFEGESQLNDDGLIADFDPTAILPALENIFFINNSVTAFFAGNYTSNQLFENGLDNYSLTDQLEKITTPSLLLWGRYDLVVPMEVGFKALANIGSEDKEIVIFEMSGHSPMSNEPVEFVSTVREFIERLK